MEIYIVRTLIVRRTSEHVQREIAQRKAAAEHHERLRAEEVRRRLRREMNRSKDKRRLHEREEF